MEVLITPTSTHADPTGLGLRIMVWVNIAKLVFRLVSGNKIFPDLEEGLVPHASSAIFAHYQR